MMKWCQISCVDPKELNFWNLCDEPERHFSPTHWGLLGHYRVAEQITWYRAPPLAVLQTTILPDEYPHQPLELQARDQTSSKVVSERQR